VRWVYHNQGTRAVYFDELLRNVKLHILPTKFLEKVVFQEVCWSFWLISKLQIWNRLVKKPPDQPKLGLRSNKNYFLFEETKFLFYIVKSKRLYNNSEILFYGNWVSSSAAMCLHLFCSCTTFFSLFSATFQILSVSGTFEDKTTWNGVFWCQVTSCSNVYKIILQAS